MTVQAIDAFTRPKQIVEQYIIELDKHIADLKAGKVEKALEIKDFASLLHIHPRHLSNTIKEVLGQSPCALYEQRLLAISKDLLVSTRHSIATIAQQLTYDPSNFTKFFKHFEGITPKAYRLANQK
jgi:AraC family transcriptional regulator, regulatory protein of adaptative response / methylphosphotriester-DNA alkyltransferase methyltransferase